MENGVIDEEFLNTFYCPGCGKPYAEHLDGELRNPCGTCGTKIRLIVNWPVFIIFGTRARKTKHKIKA